MYQQPKTLEDDNKIVRRKQKNTITSLIDANASHQPEYNIENVSRRQGGRARHIHFDREETHYNVNNIDTVNERVVLEIDVYSTLWAIQRTLVDSNVKCLGFIKGQGKNRVCHKPILGSSKGMPAPCFFAEKSHRNGVTPQYVYFCPTDSCHTWTPDNSLKP